MLCYEQIEDKKTRQSLTNYYRISYEVAQMSIADSIVGFSYVSTLCLGMS